MKADTAMTAAATEEAMRDSMGEGTIQFFVITAL